MEISTPNTKSQAEGLGRPFLSDGWQSGKSQAVEHHRHNIEALRIYACKNDKPLVYLELILGRIRLDRFEGDEARHTLLEHSEHSSHLPPLPRRIRPLLIVGPKDISKRLKELLRLLTRKTSS